MPISILQDFLNQQFIVPEQDENISSLQKAAADLEKRLRGNRRKDMPQVVLLAFDPQASANEPLIQQTQELVVAKWRNFAGKSQDQPVTYLRAVMLTALESLAADPKLAGVIWLTASNYIRYTTSTHREAAILLAFLTRIGNIYEDAAWKNWGLGKDISLPEISTAADKSLNAIPGIASDLITKELTAAVGSGSAISTFTSTYSGHKETVPVDAAWATEFGNKAGSAVSSLVNTAISRVNTVLSTAISNEYLTAYSAAIKQHLTAVTTALVEQTASQDLRSRLLWLKETQYSISQGISYRTITDHARPIVLACDAAQLVPEIYPISIEYFLRETLAVAATQAEEEQTFEALLTTLTTDDTGWRAALSAVPAAEPGRRSLLTFIAHLGHSDSELASLQQTTGLKTTDLISQSDLTIWLFRELEVQKLLASK